MSTQPWEFAYTMAQVATGTGHEPEVRIEHVEGGVYRLSVDKEALHLTAQDLLDVMDFCLLHARELSSQAEQAQIPAKGRKKTLDLAPASDGKEDETPADWKIRDR